MGIVVCVLLGGAALQAVGCSDDHEGLSVDVAVDPPTSPAKENGTRVLTNDRGYRVVLTKGYLAVSSVEIEACASQGVAGFLRELRLIRPAYAHSEGSPTRLGTPFVIPLLGDARGAIGSLSPPPRSYCVTHIGGAPADDDALFLPADAPMVGKSLYVEGTFQPPSSAEASAFTATGALAFDAEVTHAPLVLGAGGRTKATLVIGEVIDHWFDGIDFATASPDDIAKSVLEHAQQSFQVSFP
jgi:hypothetical protein